MEDISTMTDFRKESGERGQQVAGGPRFAILPFQGYICRMKALQAFMAVWILVLSLLPCFDKADHAHEHGCHDLAKESQTAVVQTHQTEHGADFELCSPFCHCSCCHTSVTFFHLEVMQSQTAPCIAVFASLEDQMQPQHRGSIWQPPKA